MAPGTVTLLGYMKKDDSMGEHFAHAIFAIIVSMRRLSMIYCKDDGMR